MKHKLGILTALVLSLVIAGSAFAALSLGFLIQAISVAVFQSGPWTRLTTARGHILVRRQSWTLKA